MAEVNALAGQDGYGFPVRVGPTGAAATHPGRTAVKTTYASVGISSGVLVPELPGRYQIEIQNQHDTYVLHVKFDASAATPSDLAIYPYDTYRFPPGVTYTGEIRAISQASPPMSVVVLEYYAVPDTGTM
jgi:hypothetical protein